MAASAIARRLLVVVALLVLVLDAEAQQRGGRRRPGALPPPTDVPKAEKEEPAIPEFLPGFDPDPGAGKKPGKGAKPAAKPAAKKPAPPKPPDPMHAADEVTALADHRARLEESEERLVQDHFRLCDLDGNGWISLREAEVTLSLDRSEYKRTDANADGRVDLQEFSAQRVLFLARLGAHPVDEGPEGEEAEPSSAPAAAPAVEAPKAEGTSAPAADAAAADAPSQRALLSEIGSMTVKPGAFLRRYDTDKSKGIDAAELEKAVAELGLELSAEQSLDSLDRNDSGQLEATELLPIAWLASQALEPASTTASAPEDPRAETVSDEIPIQASAPPAGPATTPAPKLTAAQAAVKDGAKVTHFARLDPGNDGFIDESDLRVLQGQARLDLRVKAVLSALDTDGDGRVSESEFRASMAAAPR